MAGPRPGRAAPDLARLLPDLRRARDGPAAPCTPHQAATPPRCGPGGQNPPDPPEGYAAALAEVTGPYLDRFTQFDAALDQRHPTGFAHHYLAILAVRSDRQGQGTGTALLEAHHRLLDTAIGQPAYLEASSERTRRVYLHRGYRDHGPPVVLPGGPLMFPMLRLPAQPS